MNYALITRYLVHLPFSLQDTAVHLQLAQSQRRRKLFFIQFICLCHLWREQQWISMYQSKMFGVRSGTNRIVSVFNAVMFLRIVIFQCSDVTVELSVFSPMMSIQNCVVFFKCSDVTTDLSFLNSGMSAQALAFFSMQ